MFTIGADPELFLCNRKGLVSSIGLIGGTKEDPQYQGNGIYVQEDNVAAEYNIPPCFTKQEFIYSITKGRDVLGELAKKHKLNLASVASGVFKDMYLRHPNAIRFGCDPDFNAWTGKINEPPKTENKNFRTCGGHVHIGIDADNEIIANTSLEKAAFARVFDLFLTLPSLFLDKDEERRLLYGKAGSYRNKDYGLECRTLSNFWIFDEKLISWVYDSTIHACSWVLEHGEVYMSDADDIQGSINKQDKTTAIKLMKKYGVVWEV